MLGDRSEAERLGAQLHGGFSPDRIDNVPEVSLNKLLMFAPVSWPCSSLGNDYISVYFKSPEFSNRSPLYLTSHRRSVGGW